ncbi:hypothetical protein KQX54_001459 [Cotesia glomerata]|uniref:Uncharacterized protein n=1 Tax=Cotesia glomerata TaxID=32391 RepID=A0AAV7IF54_COTGL|nr:hypothetical protein KQX54_001459 [Cotesia glomerata]
MVVIHQSRLFENNFCSWLYSKVVCHTTDRGSRRRASRRYGCKPSDFYYLIIVRFVHHLEITRADLVKEINKRVND